MSDYTELRKHVSVIQDLAPNSFPGEIVDVAIHCCKIVDWSWQEGFDKASVDYDKAYSSGYDNGKLNRLPPADNGRQKLLLHLSEHDNVFQVYLNGEKKIGAIKRLRELSGCSLKEAKDVADVLFNQKKSDDALQALREKLTGGNLPSTQPIENFLVEERLTPGGEVNFAWGCKNEDEADRIISNNHYDYPSRIYSIRPSK